MKFTTQLLIITILSQTFSQEIDLQPLPYSPQKAPEYVGTLIQNERLTESKLLFKGKISGPEDIAIDPAGNLYISNEDGIIYKSNSKSELSVFSKTEGRPLGLRFDSKGNLIVCHESMGLLSINSKGELTILVSNSQGFSLIDDLVISSNDVVYFSDATKLDGLDSFYFDILLHRPLGSVWSYSIPTNELNLVADSLYFPNGLELSNDESILFINETPMYRTLQLHLLGENKGEVSIFSDNLPGFPDGIDPASDGGYWISLASPRKWMIDSLISPSVWLKKFLMVAPEWMRPEPTLYGIIIKVNDSGEIIESYHDPSGENLHTITNVVEYDGFLYIASLLNDCVGKLDLGN